MLAHGSKARAANITFIQSHDRPLTLVRPEQDPETRSNQLRGKDPTRSSVLNSLCRSDTIHREILKSARP